jgi:hypothetical protein
MKLGGVNWVAILLLLGSALIMISLIASSIVWLYK